MTLHSPKQIQNYKQQFKQPDFEILGGLDTIVLSGGNNNDDGWFWSKLAAVTNDRMN